MMAKVKTLKTVRERGWEYKARVVIPDSGSEYGWVVTRFLDHTGVVVEGEDRAMGDVTSEAEAGAKALAALDKVLTHDRAQTSKFSR